MSESGSNAQFSGSVPVVVKPSYPKPSGEHTSVLGAGASNFGAKRFTAWRNEGLRPAGAATQGSYLNLDKV